MRSALVTIVIGVGLALAACGGTKHTASSPTSSQPPSVHLAAGLRLSSPAFKRNRPIPRAYTCDGRGVSPPLRWSGVPAGTRELVLVMRDPDAPSGNFVHWALAGIPPTAGSFGAGGVPGLVIPGRNSFGSLGYRGPCPPSGRPHHYVLTLSALPSRSGLKPGFSTDQLRTGAIAIATLIGTYGRR